MKKLFFDTIEEFVENIIDKYDYIDDENKVISIVAKYEEIKEIIKCMMFENCNLRDIQLFDNAHNEYNDEYIISLSSISEDYEIWCEPMKKCDSYLTTDSTRVYVLDNCSSKVIPYCEGNENYEVTIGESCESACGCECCGDCGCCDCEEEHYSHEVDFNDDMHGFNVYHYDENVNYSYSFYSTDKNLVAEMARLFG